MVLTMKTGLGFAALAASAIGFALVPAQAAVPAPDPYQIFANARAYWLTQRYPTELQYRIAVEITEGGKERIERYDAHFDAVHNVVNVDPTSDYEREHPVKPTGVNVSLFIIPLNKPLPTADFLGVPRLAPNYSFGMAPFVPAPTPTPFDSNALVDQIRKEFHDPNPRTSATAEATGLREIGAVVAHNRDYAITLLGTEPIDGHPCYHLALQPMRNPRRNWIREAWVDETTYAPWQLKDAANFAGDGPETNVPWTIRFADVDGAHYISEEHTGVGLSVRGEIYTSTAIRFESIVAATYTPRPKIAGFTKDVLDEP